MEESISPTVQALKAEMKRQEMSMSELAQRSKMELSTVYRVFNGERSPNLKTIEDMAAALDMKVTLKR